MLLSLLALLITGQAATPVATTPAASTVPAEKKICWRDTVTGSMMPSVRICMTRAERRAWLARMQGNVDAMTDRRQRACSGNSPMCPTG